jgi:UDP-N-acetyl-D-mannosaminuronic acid dehydrogenase
MNRTNFTSNTSEIGPFQNGNGVNTGEQDKQSLSELIDSHLLRAKFTLADGITRVWKVEKIGVIGPGIVGMPMAALLADARIKIGSRVPARVCVVQRYSKNSGWKVDSIQQGKSVIGGIEPYLADIVSRNVSDGVLSATSDYDTLADADVVLVAIQTDKDGLAPDYGPLFSGLTSLAIALQKKPEDKIPLIIFESTLAPSSMATLIKDHFAKYNLLEGRDILLGNSPNRVMPGRLVERIVTSDKLTAGLHPDTPKLIRHLYKNIVTHGTLHTTNSLTAEVVKTLENAYRDARIAFSAEIVRFCDQQNIDFYSLRNKVNSKLFQSDDASFDPNAVPSGGMLIPTVGVGGHCLPKDGILLWWRRIENGDDTSRSLILEARKINDESPAETIKLFEQRFVKIDGKNITILGAAYRFNSEDTRNSPSLQLALLLQKRGCNVIIHDPYVKRSDQNLVRLNLDGMFTSDIETAVSKADYIIMGSAHLLYIENRVSILAKAKTLKGVFDACNAYRHSDFKNGSIPYAGIGRGSNIPETSLIDFVYHSFRTFETGLANEVDDLCDFLNEHYAGGEFNKVRFGEVQQLAASCSTGCEIANPGKITHVPVYKGFFSQLAQFAFEAEKKEVWGLSEF